MSIAASVSRMSAVAVDEDSSDVEAQYRSGRGSYRNPGFNRGGVNRNPGARQPNYPPRAGGGWGGFFGGIALGTVLGTLFNPFAFMGYGPGAGSPLSFIALLFWAGVIYVIYRIVRRPRKQLP
ncbi:hypothetical protein [Paenibacillus xerothermodurans]|uniref:hypothetical protein n=1 Tax=Paenibacillus xerothermodurans TaxID=1977292 RepID=UPI0014026A84|nr:hypothetical protein [Paenibacillus xerothermodurans]